MPPGGAAWPRCPLEPRPDWLEAAPTPARRADQEPRRAGSRPSLRASGAATGPGRRGGGDKTGFGGKQAAGGAPHPSKMLSWRLHTGPEKAELQELNARRREEKRLRRLEKKRRSKGMLYKTQQAFVYQYFAFPSPCKLSFFPLKFQTITAFHNILFYF